MYHESSAALLVDGKIIAACEEERFNRVKHAKEARFDNPHELPEQAMRFCLDYAGLRPPEIDGVAYARWRDAWQLEHVTGRYVISDKPLTEEQWIAERGATVLDGDDAIDVTPPENK